MGSCCFKPPKKFDPIDFTNNIATIDSRIFGISNPSPEEKQQIIDTLAEGLNGSETHDPEFACNWNLSERYSDKNSEERKQILQYFGSWNYYTGIMYGLIFVAKDPETQQIVGVMMIRPPGSVKNGNTETINLIYNIIKILGMPAWEKDKKKWGPELSERGQAIGTIITNLHKKYAPKDHYYLASLFIKPQYQGKGYGRAFLNLFNSMCDRDNLDGYLECVGDRNKSIYEKFGFETKESDFLEVKKKPETRLDKQIHAMLRPKKDNVL